MQASSFGLYEVLQANGKGHTKFRRIKTLAGTATPDVLELDGYYALHLGSTSTAAGHEELEIRFPKGEHVYLFPRLVDKRWTVATPSAGIDVAPNNGLVHATYRISFNQTLQPVEAYERVQTCIFHKLHNDECSVASLSRDLDDPLNSPPAALSPTATEQEQKMFFAQHVALETAYLLDRDLPLKTIEPFLQADFFHQQISAVRALAASKSSARNARMVSFIKDSSRLPMAQAMVVVMAKEIGDKTLIAELKALAPGASEADSRLPLNIMDPRIGTDFPASVKEALEAL